MIPPSTATRSTARVSRMRGILFLILAAVLANGPAAAQNVSPVSKASPELASLQIELWPEFDRPAATLVILKGEIAAGVALPAPVSLRIPARSGGPTAVAYASAVGSGLNSLKFERENGPEYITLKFHTPGRVFHVEYYDPIAVSASKRSYTYSWNGDLATDHLRVVVQEPAGVNDLSVQPALKTTTTGQDGLVYRSTDFGAFPKGKRLEIKIAYTKSDARASTDIVKPAAQDAAPLPDTEPLRSDPMLWLVAITGLLGLGLGVWAGLMWWYGRKDAAQHKPGDSKFCGKCGAPRVAKARYCTQCGTKFG